VLYLLFILVNLDCVVCLCVFSCVYVYCVFRVVYLECVVCSVCCLCCEFFSIFFLCVGRVVLVVRDAICDCCRFFLLSKCFVFFVSSISCVSHVFWNVLCLLYVLCLLCL